MKTQLSELHAHFSLFLLEVRLEFSISTVKVPMWSYFLQVAAGYQEELNLKLYRNAKLHYCPPFLIFILMPVVFSSQKEL